MLLELIWESENLLCMDFLPTDSNEGWTGLSIKLLQDCQSYGHMAFLFSEKTFILKLMKTIAELKLRLLQLKLRLLLLQKESCRKHASWALRTWNRNFSTIFNCCFCRDHLDHQVKKEIEVLEYFHRVYETIHCM